MLQILGKVALAAVGVFIALALAEGVARILPPPFDPAANVLGSLHQCNRLVGWRGIPNLTAVLNTDGQYKHQIVWNSRGMHDGEHPLQPKDDVFRILMVGDSFVQASEVVETETSHQVLEDILNRHAPPNLKFEVISGGVLGWGPAQELMYLRSEGLKYQPDLILVLWVPANDLMNVLPENIFTGSGVNCYAPYFARCNEQFDPSPWFSAPGITPTWNTCTVGKKTVMAFLNYLYTHSKLYQRLAPLLAQGEHKITYSSGYAPWVRQEQPDKVLTYAYQLTADIYAQLAAEAAQNGAKTALAIVPFRQAIFYQLDSRFRAGLIKEVPLLQNGDPSLPNRTFTRLMRQQNLPVLDLHPHFVAHYQNRGEPLHWSSNFHWNIAGNRRAAELMAHWLIEQQLVPVQP